MPWMTAAAIVGSSLISGSMAQKGAQTQADAANRSANLQKQMFDIQNQQQAPYREQGYAALKDIAGLKPYLTQQFGPEQFAAGIDPGYAFRLKQGEMQAQRMANQGGGLLGGNALRGLEDYTQGAASQEYQNAFNRFQTQRGNIYNTLASIAGLGQTSLGQTTNAATTAGANIGNAISNAGAALGGGQVAMGNALGGSAQQIGNQFYLANLLKPRTGGGAGAYPTDASGNVIL